MDLAVQRGEGKDAGVEVPRDVPRRRRGERAGQEVLEDAVVDLVLAPLGEALHPRMLGEEPRVLALDPAAEEGAGDAALVAAQREENVAVAVEEARVLERAVGVVLQQDPADGEFLGRVVDRPEAVFGQGFGEPRIEVAARNVAQNLVLLEADRVAQDAHRDVLRFKWNR